MSLDTSRRFVVLALIAVLAIATVWGYHWWRHPVMFSSGPVSGFSAHPEPLSRATLYAAVALPPTGADHRERLTINSARANYSHNSVPVTSTFAICTVGPGPGTIGVSTTTTPEDFCRSLRPLRPGSQYDYNPGRTEQIVLTMRPRGAGTATLTSIELDYSRTWSHGGQRGVQHLPEYFQLTAE